MKKLLKTCWIFIPLILAAAMYFILPFFPDFTEYVFSRGLFKAVSIPVGFLTSLVPISLTEAAAVLALPAVIFLIVLLVVKLRKSFARKKTALAAARGTCAFLSFACLMYMICHGANFYRQPLEKTMGLDTSPKTADRLVYVCGLLIKGAAEAEAELPADPGGATVLPDGIYDELCRASNGYDKLCGEYPFLRTSVWRQKPVQLSEPWSYTGITGMYFPFFCECNVNIAQPDFLIPAVASHESAHSRGIAFENECNFMAFLSCINSDYPEYRYSGYMLAYIHCSNALYAYSEELWEQVDGCITDRMRADFRANNKFIYDHQRHDDSVSGQIIGAVNEVSEAANDAFIKAQGVEDGTLSYDRVTELILAYYCK